MNYKSIHTHSAACLVGLCLGILFPIWQVVLCLTIWIVIGNYFVYKTYEEDEEEIVENKWERKELAQHAPIPDINIPKLKPYSPRNPPVPLSAYQKSRMIQKELGK